MQINDIKIFNDKNLNSLLEQIYNNQKNKSSKIQQLVQQLQNMVTTVDQAIMLVPSIANYLTIGVKNDQILIKLTQSITKLLQNSLKQKLLDNLSAKSPLITDAQFEQLISKSKQQAVLLLTQEQKLQLQLNKLQQGNLN